MNNIDMTVLGFTQYFSTQRKLYEGMCPGRIISQYKDLYKAVCENGELICEVSGNIRYNAVKLSDYPAVGDFVMLDRNTDINGNAIIHAILSRKSSFVRKAAGTTSDEQIVASNIDVIFICMSLNNDFNIRRLERYLAIAWDSGATPVVVLTKADICNDLEEKLRLAESAAIGVHIIVSSSCDEKGYLAVREYIKVGITAAFIGSSGVGKSTLINRLAHCELVKTGDVRNDGKGRHTTTHRSLLMLANGGMVIDTPGMRELGVETADIQKTFADIDSMLVMCRFSDCSHTSEPGCAVQKAISDGILSAERLNSYKKLKKESEYEGLNSRQIEKSKIDSMFGGMSAMKSAQKMIREKNKKRGN